MGEWLPTWAQHLGSLLALLLAVLTSVHVVLHKREARSAAGWVGLIWLVPLVGSLLYVLLGINRIRRRALSMRKGSPRYVAQSLASHAVTPDALGAQLSVQGAHLSELSAVIDRVTVRRLCAGNRVELLVDGDRAYPAMLEAIERAERSISLMTYIFETDGVGHDFVEALTRAHARGVQVRVLIDAVGARYAYPRPDRVLRRRQVPTALFMPIMAPWRAPYFNLRNHRKIMVVDGTIGFTGGINIRKSHVLSANPREPTRDLHFRLGGPVVSQLQEVFAEDWEFTTRERLEGERWFPACPEQGLSFARVIADGPDEDLDKFTWTLHAALVCARRRVRIVTPYFLPDTAFAIALRTAALRGVEVDLVLPQRGNLTLVQWAMARQLEEVVGDGIRVWLSPAPFDHSKLMLIDEGWALIGSSNWDARSLRLNFEVDVEVYDRTFCDTLHAQVDARIEAAHALSASELFKRPAWQRVRDGFARLLMPYL